ncbi:hypothetical protein N2W48_001766 [Clostridium perfringens]|nr:hypothetical protein [Clostridium perfringens]EJT6664590.1 hypothetical protein [Clostridium perfringens]
MGKIYGMNILKLIIDYIQYYFGHSVGAKVGKSGVDGFISKIDKLYEKF